MDYEKLIEQAKKDAKGDYPIVPNWAAIVDKKRIGEYATALSTLRAENEKLRAELEQVKRERDAAISDLTYIAQTYPVDLCDDLVCQYCKHYPNVNTGCPGWTENDCFEWRGPEEG